MADDDGAPKTDEEPRTCVRVPRVSGDVHVEVAPAPAPPARNDARCPESLATAREEEEGDEDLLTVNSNKPRAMVRGTAHVVITKRPGATEECPGKIS